MKDFHKSRYSSLSVCCDLGLKLAQRDSDPLSSPAEWAEQHPMSAMGALRLSRQRPCRQPISLAIPRRADRAVLCRGADDLRRKPRFSFRYRKSLVSLGFRKLLEKADRAVHRAQPAIQAVAQAEQQVCLHALVPALDATHVASGDVRDLFLVRRSLVVPEQAHKVVCERCVCLYRLPLWP